MSRLLHPEGSVTSEDVVETAERNGTPAYLYDDSLILGKREEISNMPNAFGLFPRFAMKANSNRHLLQIISGDGEVGIDASSLNEVRRARMAGIPYSNILLTTQEVPEGKDRLDLNHMMLEGLQYNVCSTRQLEEVAGFASENDIHLSMRVHPLEDVGSGESITRDTASKYSCFGLHMNDLEDVLELAKDKEVKFRRVHDHIGSGGDPEKWKENTRVLLRIIEEYFSSHPVSRVNFGGGIKEGRMPQEEAANIQELGRYAAKEVKEFARRTGKQLITEVEPGTYQVANAGYVVTRVMDKKSTGAEGFNFLVLDGGMEVNTRSLMYASKTPFYVVSKKGELLSSEFDLSDIPEGSLWVPVGRCCESGDSQSLDEEGHIIPRQMAEPDIGDYVVIGGCGAYCSTMSPHNYNSYTQAQEFSKLENGDIAMIRAPQSLDQIVQNETSEIR